MTTLFDVERSLPDGPLRTWLQGALDLIAEGENPRDVLMLDFQCRKAERDRLIRQAVAVIDAETTWRAWVAIEGHLKGRHRHRVSGVVAELIEAADRACRVPRSARGIWNIAAEDQG